LEASNGHPAPSLTTLKTIFQPFQLACLSRQPVLASIAIDCLAKLFSYNYWGKPDDGGEPIDIDPENLSSPGVSPTDAAPSTSLMGMVIDSICDSFSGGENTDDRVQLQIIKVRWK
jgi:brefeldin A-inhibited guanine nucleotide-exchange protein